MDVATQQLTSLCDALELGPVATKQYLSQQELLLQPWAERPIPERAPFPSRIGDDHSPYEYSLSLTRDSYELRLLVEAQAPEPSFLANQREGVALLRRVATRFNLDLERFDRVADLFLPERPGAPFSIWLGTSFSPIGTRELEVYFNPQVHGPELGRRVVKEALAMLELEAAERALDAVAFRGDDVDEIKYFSLDLPARASATVKIYVCHHHAKALPLERAFSVSPSHRAGDVAGYCATVLGRSGPFSRKPLSSCLAFVRGRASPLSITLHVPVAHYLSESMTVAHTRAYLERNGIDARPYLRAWTALGRLRRSTTSALQSYLSYRRESAGLRVTVYLSPCLFGVTAAG